MDQVLRRDGPTTLNVPDAPAIIRPEREAVPAVEHEVTAVEHEVVAVEHEVVAVEHEGLISAYVVGPCSPLVARWAARRGLTPDAVSAISVAAAAVAAVWFSAGTRGGLASGALLLGVSHVLGQAGRGRPRGGLGDWPAAVLDRVKEFGVYAGLAAGAAVSGEDLWWAAMGAVALLSVRHAAEGSFAASRARPPGTVLRRAGNSLGLPSGERLALIAVTAAVADARLTFTVLLAWGSAATAATLTGRSKRSMT